MFRDRCHLLSMVSGNALSELVVTLSAIIVRRSNSMDDERSRNAFKRVVEEFSEYKLPALAVEMASVSLFPKWQERVLHRVEDEMVSTSDDVVLDALTAIQVLSQRVATDVDVADKDKERENLVRLLRSASQMVRLRRGTVLSATINTVRYVLAMHPWTFDDDVERSVLVGLHRLIGDTAVHRASAPRIDENGSRKDVSAKLLDVSRSSWKKNGALRSIIRVSDQAATSACLRTSLRPW